MHVYTLTYVCVCVCVRACRYGRLFVSVGSVGNVDENAYRSRVRTTKPTHSAPTRPHRASDSHTVHSDPTPCTFPRRTAADSVHRALFRRCACFGTRMRRTTRAWACRSSTRTVTPGRTGCGMRCGILPLYHHIIIHHICIYEVGMTPHDHSPYA